MNSTPQIASFRTLIRDGGAWSDATAAVLLIALAVFALLGFELDWDTIAYHLPYAALRSGILSGDQLALSPGLLSRYRGFPGFIDLLQAGLWRMFGTPKAAALVAPIAMTAFAVYARLVLRLRLIWPVAIFLGVPILQTAIQSAYVDLWTNAFFSIHLLAAFRSLRMKGRASTRSLLLSLAALAVAVNSKEQFYLVGAASAGLYGALLLLRAVIEPAARRDTRRQIGLALVLAPLVFFAPLKNFVLYANPIYPIDMPVLGWLGPEKVQFPAARTLAHTPRMLRYLLSQFDLNGLSGRARGYTIDQGENEVSVGYHMGGSSGILLFATLVTLAVCLRRVAMTRMDKAAAAAFAALVLLVADFPGANELRYFSFVNIVLLTAALCLLRQLAATDRDYAAGLQAGFRATLLGSVLFTCFVTDFLYVIPHPRSVERAIEDRPAIRAELRQALQAGDTVCYSRFDPYGFLYADIFNQSVAGKRYKLILDLDGLPCPAGSAEIKRQDTPLAENH